MSETTHSNPKQVNSAPPDANLRIYQAHKKWRAAVAKSRPGTPWPTPGKNMTAYYIRRAAVLLGGESGWAERYVDIDADNGPWNIPSALERVVGIDYGAIQVPIGGEGDPRYPLVKYAARMAEAEVQRYLMLEERTPIEPALAYRLMCLEAIWRVPASTFDLDLPAKAKAEFITHALSQWFSFSPGSIFRWERAENRTQMEVTALLGRVALGRSEWLACFQEVHGDHPSLAADDAERGLASAASTPASDADAEFAQALEANMGFDDYVAPSTT